MFSMAECDVLKHIVFFASSEKLAMYKKYIGEYSLY